MTREHAEFLQANTEAVTSLEKRLQVVQQILDEVANELGWLARNIQDLSIGPQGEPRVDESVHCMECEAEPIRALADALRQGWTELMLHEDRYMGMCPDCMKRDDDQVEATRRPIAAPDAAGEWDKDIALATGLAEAVPKHVIGEGVATMTGMPSEQISRSDSEVDQAESIPDVDDEKTDEQSAAATPQPAPRRRGGADSKQPLYMRMYFEAHLTALVRMIGYAGFPAAEGPQRVQPLLEEYGRERMRAAADEIVGIDNSSRPPMARLTAQARALAAGILGRPQEAPSALPQLPPSPAPEPSVQADAAAPAATEQTAKGEKPKAASRATVAQVVGLGSEGLRQYLEAAESQPQA